MIKPKLKLARALSALVDSTGIDKTGANSDAGIIFCPADADFKAYAQQSASAQ
jgi:hypothetical protein